MKPFRLTSTPGLISVARDRDGRFKRLSDTPAPDIAKEMGQGNDLHSVLRKERVPDKPTSGRSVNVAGPGQKEAPVYEESLPWPKAGPVNDSNKAPFKGLKLWRMTARLRAMVRKARLVTAQAEQEAARWLEMTS